MRRILFSIAFVFLGILSFAQYGNEWIDYTKPYFKIKISNEGVYRISSSTLNSVGLNFIDAENFVLYRDGEQVPIYIEMNGANVSFIEFYAYPNDGKLDEQLFETSADHMHSHFSLFTNESTYFLSYTDNVGNARLESTNNDLTNLPTPEPYFWHTERQLFTSSYSAGERHYLGSDGLIASTFDRGEGFMGANSDQFNNSTTTRTYNIATPHLYNTSLTANLKTVVVGWTRYDHHFKVKVGSTEMADYQFYNFDLVKSNDDFSTSLMGNTTPVVFEAIGTSTGVNRNTPSMIELTYPRLFDFDNTSMFSFSLEGNNTKQYLELENFDAQSAAPILYDMTYGYRIEAVDVPSSSMFRFALPAEIGERELLFFSSSSTNINMITSLSQTNYTDYTSLEEEGNYIMLANALLKGSSEFDEYVQYRESFAGGNYQVAEINVEELYDQFAYGVEKHPMSIRNFISYAIDNWAISPRFLFIIGKGREYHDMRNNIGAFNQCQVPTFGNPGSDVLLASTNTDLSPRLAVGRIVADDPLEISIYLEKIKQYEAEVNNTGDPYQTVENKAWQKEILHLGGGVDAGEQNLFKSYLNSYATMAKDTSWGASTYSVFKTTSAPLQNIQSEVLKEKINNGISLMTFFGHSYAGGFDVNFDEPENYTNVGKYPIFVANGCFAGVIHDGGIGISERFVLADQKGSIAFMATSELSSSSGLHNYSRNLYQNFSNEIYNATLGEVVQQTTIDVENGSIHDRMVSYEMNLHGDPAIPMNQYEVPDYNIEVQNVFFEPQNITSSLDSFTINLGVYNLGKAITDSFNVEIKRVFPDGSQEVFIERFAAPYFKDTMSLKLPVVSNQVGVGLNQFGVFIDVNDEINNELSETNNILPNDVPLFVGSDDIYPIHPYEFCIVPSDDIILKASTGDAFSPMSSYVFQIDTSELFISPLEETVISSIGGVVEWEPSIVFQDDRVYYWRASKEGENNWQASSFVYLDGETPGWNQSHYYQYQKDRYENVYLDTDREFK
ncbi:MAG: C25 family cysteine peptidase, partial [Chitinophagales bacterium]